MIKLYSGANIPVEGLIQYQDLKIEEEQDQLNVVSFNVPREEADLIEHEGYVEVKNNGRYVIKEKNYDDDDQIYEIVGLYDLEELQGYIESAAYVSMTLTAMMDILLAGTGWTFVTNDITVRTSTGVTIDRLDFIYAIVRDTFGLEIKFDNQARIIYADEMLGEDKGVYFSDEVNLTALTVDSDSYDFATRIIPRGKDGLSIEAINGGLPYLENLTYSSKVITKYWSDERYTVLENLKAEAQKKLDAICKPLMSYSAKAQDLYRTHAEEFGHLEYNVSDTITLINKETNTKEKQRIVKRVKYPDVPEDDTVTIANRIRSFISESQQDFDGVKQDFSVIRASLQLLDESVEAKVSKSDYSTDKEVMDNNYSEFKLEYDAFKVTVQTGGGNNLIKNSVGYAEDKYWNILSGAASYSQSSWVLEGDAKHGWILEDVSMFGDLILTPGQTYTLRFKLKKGLAGSVQISVDEMMTAYICPGLKLLPGEEYDGIYQMEFLYTGAVEPVIALIASGAFAELTDLSITRGTNTSYWSSANGEIYTLKVQMDAAGVKVYRADGKGYTIMSPEEFAGYYNNQKIFTLNGDITEVMGLEIKGKGLWMRPVKIVQTNSSIDFVWTGV